MDNRTEKCWDCGLYNCNVTIKDEFEDYRMAMRKWRKNVHSILLSLSRLSGKDVNGAH